MSQRISPRMTSAPASALLLGLGLALTAAPAASAATKANAYQQVIPKTFAYDTTGRVQAGAAPRTIKGPNQLSFDGVSNAVYATGSGQTIQLGQFVVTPAKTAAGASAVTTYDGTPFVIQVKAPGHDKSSSVPVLAGLLPSFGKSFHLKSQTINSLLIRGHLDGTVNGANSSVTATVDSVRPGGLGAGPKNTAVTYTFPVRYNDLKLPTSWSMNTANAALAAAAIPGAGAATSANSATAAAQVLANPAAEELTANPIATPVPTPTPEPSTLLIFAAGAGAIAYARRRRRA